MPGTNRRIEQWLRRVHPPQGSRRVWAEARLADFGKIQNFDVHPDGRRIVVEARISKLASGTSPSSTSAVESEHYD